MNNYDYPLGADTSSAPWNETDKEPKKVKVTISLVLSKTMDIEVDDYNVVEDENNSVSYDFSDCNLRQAVTQQVILPHEVYGIFGPVLSKHEKTLASHIDDLKDWVVDDFEVIPE